MKYNDGIHDITNTDYHASEGVSRSALMKLKRSPYHYWHEYINPEYVKPEPTPDMVLGSLVHTLTLEPEKFHEEYIKEPDLMQVPKVGLLKDLGREEYDKQKTKCESVKVANELLMDEFKLQSENKTIIKDDVLKKAWEIAHSVIFDENAKALLEGAQIEKSIFCTHEPTGLQFKVRPDIWLGGVVSDLKTTRDASPHAFQSASVSSGYLLQAGMIKEALEYTGQTLEAFCFIAVEKQAPYPVAIYQLDEAAIEYGVNLFNELMVRLKECKERDAYPSYGIRTLCAPNWLTLERDLNDE